MLNFMFRINQCHIVPLNIYLFMSLRFLLTFDISFQLYLILFHMKESSGKLWSSSY